MWMRIRAIALPASASQVLGTSLGFVDVLIVSSLGAAPLAALGIVTSSRVLFLLLFYAIASAGALIVAFAIGNHDPAEAKAAFTGALVTNMAIGVVVSIGCLLFPREILSALSANPILTETGAAYLRPFAPYFLLMSCILCLSTIGRAAGIVRAPFYAAAASMFVNTAANLHVVYGLGGATEHKMAMLGAAMSLSRTLEIAILLYAITKYTAVLRLSKSISKELKRRMLRLAAPIVGKEFTTSAAVIVLTLLFVRIDAVAYAALAVVLSFERFLLGLLSGSQVAATVLISRFLGAGRIRAADMASRILLMGTGFFSFGLSAVLLLSWTIMSSDIGGLRLAPFVSDAIRMDFLSVMLMALPVRAINYLLIDGLLRARRLNNYALMVDGIYYWLLAVPCGLALWKLADWGLVEIFGFLLFLELFRTAAGLHGLWSAILGGKKMAA